MSPVRGMLTASGALAAVLFGTSASYAQVEERNDGPDTKNELVAPTPPEWTVEYEAARSKLLAGEFTEAAALFAELEKTAVNRVDRAIAHEQLTLVEAWLKKNPHGNANGNAVAAKAVDTRAYEELVLLYTNAIVYGIGSGIWVDVIAEPGTTATHVLPILALTGASIGTVVALDSGRGLPYGVAQGIVSGMWIGLEEGFAWTVWANNRKGVPNMTDKLQATILWSTATAGAIGGGVLGATLGTTPGRSSWVGSCALWTGAVTGFAMGAAVDEANLPPAALAAAGVGVTLGTALGLGSASAVSPSNARVHFIDLGGLGGGLLAAGAYIGAASGKADGRVASGLTAVGGAAGLAAVYALTASMPDDHLRTEQPPEPSAIASVRPLLMPAQGGGGMMGVGGLLQ